MEMRSSDLHVKQTEVLICTWQNPRLKEDGETIVVSKGNFNNHLTTINDDPTNDLSNNWV